MGVGGVIGNMGDVAYGIILIDDTEEGCNSAVKNLDKVSKQADLTTESLAKITAAFGLITVASTAVLSASDRVVTLERSTARAAYTQGLSNREMYEYVKGLSSATDSQEEVGKTISFLTQSGVKWGDELTDLYEVMDTLGDATGTTSDKVAQSLIPAFRALGIPLSEIKDYMDAFAYAANHTSMTLDDLSWYVMRFGEDFQKSGLGIEDIIATFEEFDKLGIPTRTAMSYLNTVFDKQADSVEAVTKAQKELLSIQEKLNDLQEEGTANTEEYRIAMKQAGGDIAKQISITQSYEKAVRQQKRDEAKLQAEATAQQAALSKAQSATKVDILAELEKIDSRLKSETIRAESLKLQSEAIKGTAEAVAGQAEFATASEKAKYELDTLQQAIGMNTPQYIADYLPYISLASGTLTTISGVLTTMKMLMGAQGAGTLAGGAGGIAGGAGTAGTAAALGTGGLIAGGAGGLVLGGLTVSEMEKAGLLGLPEFMGGTGKGLVQEAGAQFAGTFSGNNESRYLMEYLKTHNGAYPPGYDPRTGRKSETAGTEYVSPEMVAPGPGKSAEDNRTFVTINGGITLSKDYTTEKFLKDVETYNRNKRIQSGVRS